MYCYTSFYSFQDFPEARIPEIKLALEQEAQALGIRGLVILASEGINSTMSGEPAAIERMKAVVRELLGDSQIFFKDTEADIPGFRRFLVKCRPEIVTSSAHKSLAGQSTLGSIAATPTHLSPQQWDEMLQGEGSEDVVVLDTRNEYEYEIGHFRGAINPQINNFDEFQAKLRQLDIPRDKKILMYCTGGIRCEKAIFEAQELGYKQVFQLHGGIINYLAEHKAALPEESVSSSVFTGECFVFDGRVALTAELTPTQRYCFCHSCGDAADLQGPHRVREDGRVICSVCLND